MKAEVEKPDIVVDRGMPVIVEGLFSIDPEPDEVYFIYTKPGSERPHVDDGYGQAQSRISRLHAGVYRYVIDTTGFTDGKGNWCFRAEWLHPRPEGYDKTTLRGTYVVKPAPEQLG